MINISNVSKRFKDHEVLSHINLKLPRYGLIIIKGPSGCGKTTLLNLISGLLPFEGEIEVDGHQLQLMKEKEKDDFRLRNYGFVFQDFKLFENETVLNNITFPLEVTSSAIRESKERKCASLLSMVGLRKSLKQKASSLSGGEKQRVAIARALINNPKIILADEPTGALDEKNGKDIMKVFQTISLRSLVIMVTHDDDIAREYGDEIIEMMDGEIINIIHQEKSNKDKYIPLSKMYYTNKRSEIPSSFLLNHTLTSLKQKKWRTMICNGITSLGLIGVGLASSLSSAISTNIKKSYSQLIDDSKITITMKESNNSLRGMYAASKYEAYDLLENNQDLIYDIGCTYYNDFESFFPHKNCIALADTNYYAPIEGISARHINEFRWLDVEHPQTIYPNDIEYLQNDQVVLSLTIDMVYDICYELKIVRTVTSLSRYLLEKPLKIYFDFENRNWEYSDQQLLDVVGFTLENKAGIYHNNHMWNEYMFEEKMRFPKDDAISLSSKLPWTLKKIYYFYSRNNTEELLKRALNNKSFQPFVLEIADERYYPWFSIDNEQNMRKRALIFANTRNDLPIFYYDLMTDLDDSITNPIYGSLAGYSIYPSAMMYGFSSFMYFSSNIDSLNETIDINTTLNPNDNENVELPIDVLCGHYSQTITGGVNFRTISDEAINGRVPNNYEEIVISSGIVRNIFEGDALDEELHIAYLFSQKVLDYGTVIKHFKTSSVKIVGVIDNEKNIIYHDSGWTLLFFQTQLGVSAFNLGINSMIIEVKDNSNIAKVITKLEKGFPELDFAEPMSSINDGINQVCFYIQIALTIFSTIAIIISILLLSICDYLYILENKKDIGLVRCIGVNKKEARKFVVTHSVIMSFISFLLSSIELIATSFLISLELSFQMGTSFEFSFNPISLIYMFVLAFSISLISSLTISYRINKLDPLAALKS